MSFRKNILKITLCVIVFYLFNLIILNSLNKKSKILATDSVQKTNNETIKCENHCTYCDSFVWVNLDRKMYFKQTNQFYLIDTNKFHTFYVIDITRSKFPIRLIIKFFIFYKQKQLTVYDSNELVLNQPWSVNEYGLGSIEFDLNLKDYLINNHSINFETDLKFLNIKFYYQDLTSSQMTSRLLKLNMKKLRTNVSSKWNTSLLCAKCYYMQTNEYKHFNWWIEMNKRSGYDKIIMCNNSIPNTNEFNRILKKNKNFLHLNRLNCFPNFRADFKSFYFQDIFNFNALNQDIFNGLIVNEVIIFCLLYTVKLPN